MVVSVLFGAFLIMRHKVRENTAHGDAGIAIPAAKPSGKVGVGAADSPFSSMPGRMSAERHGSAMQGDAVRESAAVDISRIGLIEGGVDVADIPAALEYLRSRGTVGKAGELTVALLRQWAESDVEQAARWLATMPAGEVRQRAVKDVATLWANKDSAAAIRWIGQLPEGEERDGAVTRAAYEIVRTEPEVAMELAIRLPVSRDGDHLVQHIALQWAEKAPQGAAAWAEGLPDDDELKERVQANIATAWGENDPVHAARYAVLSIKPGRALDDAVVAIVQRWVQQDPDAAAQWVDAFPEGALSETAAENILKLWPEDRD
jgi:hypothetical protein